MLARARLDGGFGLAFAACIALSCSRSPAHAPSFSSPARYEHYVSEVPEVETASLLVLLHAGWHGMSDSERDDLGDLELAFWPSGYVVWAWPNEDGALRHRGGRLSADLVQGLVSKTASVIEEHGGQWEFAVDAGSEEVWLHRGGTNRGVELRSVFAERDSKWDGRLPGIGYPGNTPDDPERYSLEEILELEKEREPQKVELYRAWHSIKDELRAALPNDGELVDRAKLATLGLR